MKYSFINFINIDIYYYIITKQALYIKAKETN